MTRGGSPASNRVNKWALRHVTSKQNKHNPGRFPKGYNVNMLKLAPPIYKRCKGGGSDWLSSVRSGVARPSARDLARLPNFTNNKTIGLGQQNSQVYKGPMFKPFNTVKNNNRTNRVKVNSVKNNTRRNNRRTLKNINNSPMFRSLGRRTNKANNKTNNKAKKSNNKSKANNKAKANNKSKANNKAKKSNK